MQDPTSNILSGSHQRSRPPAAWAPPSGVPSAGSHRPPAPSSAALRADSQIGGDPPDRHPGTRLVQRDGIRFELRRIVLHDHEMSDLRSSRSISQESNIRGQGPCPAAREGGRVPLPVTRDDLGRTGVGGELARHQLTARHPGRVKHRVVPGTANWPSRLAPSPPRPGSSRCRQPPGL